MQLRLLEQNISKCIEINSKNKQMYHFFPSKLKNSEKYIFSDNQDFKQFSKLPQRFLISIIMILFILVIYIGSLITSHYIIKEIDNFQDILNKKEYILFFSDLINNEIEQQNIFYEKFNNINQQIEENNTHINFGEFIQRFKFNNRFSNLYNYLKNNKTFANNINRYKKNSIGVFNYEYFNLKISEYYSTNSPENIHTYLNCPKYWQTILYIIYFNLSIEFLFIILFLFIFLNSRKFISKLSGFINFYNIFSILFLGKLIQIFFIFFDKTHFLVEYFEDFSSIIFFLSAQILDINFTLFLKAFIFKELNYLIIQYLSLYTDENFFSYFTYLTFLSYLIKYFLQLISIYLLLKLKNDNQRKFHLKDTMINYLFDTVNNFNEKYIFFKNNEFYFMNKPMKNFFDKALNLSKKKDYYSNYNNTDDENLNFREYFSDIFKNLFINKDLPSELKNILIEITDYIEFSNIEKLVYKTNESNLTRANYNSTFFNNDVTGYFDLDKYKTMTNVNFLNKFYTLKYKNTILTNLRKTENSNFTIINKLNQQIDTHINFLINRLIDFFLINNSEKYILLNSETDSIKESGQIKRRFTEKTVSYIKKTNTKIDVLKRSFTDKVEILKNDKKPESGKLIDKISIHLDKVTKKISNEKLIKLTLKDYKKNSYNHFEDTSYILIGEKIIVENEDMIQKNSHLNFSKTFYKLLNSTCDFKNKNKNQNNQNLNNSLYPHHLDGCKLRTENVYLKYNKILNGFEIMIKNSSFESKNYSQIIPDISLKKIFKSSILKLCHEFRNPLLNVVEITNSLKAEQNSIIKKIDNNFKIYSMDNFKSESSFHLNINELNENEISDDNSYSKLNNKNTNSTKIIMPIINFNQNNLIFKNNTLTNININNNKETIKDNSSLNNTKEEKEIDEKYILNSLLENKKDYYSPQLYSSNKINSINDSDNLKINQLNLVKNEDYLLDSNRKSIHIIEPTSRSVIPYYKDNFNIATETLTEIHELNKVYRPSLYQSTICFKKKNYKITDNDILSHLISSNFECINEHALKIRSICNYLNFSMFELEYLSNFVSKNSFNDYVLEIKEKIKNNCFQINIRKEIESLKKLIKTKISLSNKNLDFIVFFNEDTPNSLNLDIETIKKMLFLLIKNSIDFSKSGEIMLQICFKNNYLIFELNDNGMGIKPNDIKKIGNLFFKSKNSNNIKGIGLGFFIFKIHLLVLNGEYNIKSKFGKGTKIIFSIPLETSDDKSEYKLQINNNLKEYESIYKIEKSSFSNFKKSKTWENNFLASSKLKESSMLKYGNSISERKGDLNEKDRCSFQSSGFNSKSHKNLNFENDIENNFYAYRNFLKNYEKTNILKKENFDLKDSSILKRSFQQDLSIESDVFNNKNYIYNNDENNLGVFERKSEQNYIINSKNSNYILNNNSSQENANKNDFPILNKKSTKSCLDNLEKSIDSMQNKIYNNGHISNINQSINNSKKFNNIESHRKNENEGKKLSFKKAIYNSPNIKNSSILNNTIMYNESDIIFDLNNLDLNLNLNSGEYKLSENRKLYSERDSKSIIIKNNNVNKKINILVVDDEDLIRKSNVRFCTKYFKKSNFQKIELNVDEAVDGIEALYLIFKSYSNGIRYDIIITDETMNFMKGSLMAKIIKNFCEENIFYDMVIGSLTSYDLSSIKANKNSIYFDFIGTKPISNLFVDKLMEIYKRKFEE